MGPRAQGKVEFFDGTGCGVEPSEDVAPLPGPQDRAVLRFNRIARALARLDGVGMSLYTKRLEAGKFLWPVSQDGTAVSISAAQLGYLLEGIDWRNPRWTQRPAKAG